MRESDDAKKHEDVQDATSGVSEQDGENGIGGAKKTEQADMLEESEETAKAESGDVEVRAGGESREGGCEPKAEKAGKADTGEQSEQSRREGDRDG